MILISAGHNQYKQGAEFGNITEYKEAKKWAALIVEYLENSGISCLLVPSLSLSGKVKFINENHSSAAVEIHFNSDEGKKGRGSETLHYPGSKKGIELANLVQTGVSKVFTPNRGIKPGFYQADSAKPVNFFLKETKCPAVIIEPEFIHNIYDVITKREECCKKIASALEKHEKID